MVNPLGMMVYMGAIANDGEAVFPSIIDPKTLVGKQVSKITAKSDKMIEPETAETLKEMMANNVENHYDADWRFPDLPLCAKTGTAEVEGQDSPNSWLAGFLDDEDHPYAFIVLVEEGGYGLDSAGSVANEVLQDIIKD